MSLLEQFFKEEATRHVCRLILGAVHEHEMQPNEVQRKFEFNRFEVTLDSVSDVALVEDGLDPASNGEVRITAVEFVEAVLNHDGMCHYASGANNESPLREH